MAAASRAPGAVLVAAAVAAGCGGPPAVGRARFANRPAVWRVNDRGDVAKQPAERPFPEKLYFFDAVFHRRVTRAMDLPTPRRALDVNAFGEVPDSTWFTNRIGVRDLSLDEIRRGPNSTDGPDLSAKWQVKSSKVGGGSVGLIIEDARGDRYIIKFDEPDVPVIETATDVAVQRLLWAVGYNVPEDSIVYFERDQLVRAPDASIKDVFGNKRPMTERDIDERLGKIHRRADGRYRAVASKFLPGVPLGGFPMEGVRDDDPNDTIPHEHRRVVRGLYVVFSWLQQTDVKEDNTLDIWTEDPDRPGKHYVLHYLVDFGKSLGASAFITKRPGDGHVENLDFEYILLAIPALGLWRRPFEGTDNPPIVGIGMFDAEHYNPGAWKSHAPYVPFYFADEQDMFWAAKIIIRFRREQIRVALEQARFEDPRALDYLEEVLVARQRKAARYWFNRVNPLDRFELSGGGGALALCFDDLLVTYGLEPGAPARTTYHATSYDRDGRELGWHQQAAIQPGGARRACVDGLAPATTHDGYTIVRLDTLRGEERLAPVEVHLATDPASGRSRIVGIERH
jgi:hypothetical protein